MAKRDLKIFNNQYVVKKKLSSGSFGVVFLGEDKLNGGFEVAMKIEKEDNEEAKSLDREAQFLSKLQGIQGIPKLHWSGQEGPYNVIVQQLLGKDLAYYVKNLKKFSLKTVLLIADQLIQILEKVHDKSIIHRDMKPENILVGYKNQNMSIYLVDFGISKFYKDSRGEHIQFKEDKPFIGTTRYASVGAHKGSELGRSDDLESLAYVLIFLFKGSLPWQNLQNVQENDKTKVVGQLKYKMDANILCKDMPIEFVQYLEYVRKASFKSQPDYKYLLQLLRKAALNNNIKYDNIYDWLEFENKQAESVVLGQEKKSRNEFNNIEDQSSNKLISYEGKGKLDKMKSDEKKRGSLYTPDMPSISITTSQFDFLRPPDPYAKGRALIQRTQDKHRSVASITPSLCSQARTFQSSVANVYQSSSRMIPAQKYKTQNILTSHQKQIENSMLNIDFKFVVQQQDEQQNGFQDIVSLKDDEEEEEEEEGTILSYQLYEDDLSTKYQNLVQIQVKAQFKKNLNKLYKDKN